MPITRLRSVRGLVARALGISLLFSSVGDLSAFAKPRKPKTPCNNSAQNSPAAQQRHCSTLVFNKLYFNVKRFCKTGSIACKQTDSCGTLASNIAKGNGCSDARELVQHQCYRPGEPGYEGHMKQINQVNNTLNKCIDMQDERCP